MLREISLLSIKAKEFDWHVSQKFETVSGKIITVNGWGFSKSSALENFEQEKLYTIQDEINKKYTLLDEICTLLYDFAGEIDKLYKGE